LKGILSERDYAQKLFWRIKLQRIPLFMKSWIKKY
jgi:hypothetical protein